jgi:hypothetical protein
MITIKQIHSLLQRCRYKPGSEFRCEPIVEGLGSLRDIDLYQDTPVMVHISMRVINVLDGGETFVRGSFKLERGELEQMDEMQFLERLRKEISRSEEHEIDEWFLVDGNYYREPHPEMRRELAWHQKEPNTDLNKRREPRPRPWKTHWPEFTPEKGKEAVSAEEAMFPLDRKPDMEKWSKLQASLMASEMKSGLMRDMPTLKMTPEPGAPNGKRPVPLPPLKPPKKVMMNTTSAMGIKLRQQSKPSQLRSSRRNK